MAVLVVAAVAALMMVRTGIAPAQEATALTQDDDGGIEVTAKGDPTITPLRPDPGSRVKDRTPTIEAKISDKDRELGKGDIKLRIDGNKVRDFTYYKGRNLLRHISDKNLSYGKHTVKVIAGPPSDRSTRSWSFRVVR